MKKSLLWIVVLLLSITMVAMVSLVGCKEEAPAEEEVAEVEEEVVEEEVAEVEEEVAAEPITIVFGSRPNEPQPAWDNVLAAFQEDNPNITLDIQQYPDDTTFYTKWAAGERPDITIFAMNSQWYLQLRPTETMVDLSDQPFIQRILYDSVLDAGTIDGKVYAMGYRYPFFFGAFYNKDIFAQLNLTIPTNYVEFFELCETIKAAGITPLFAGGADKFPLVNIPMVMWTDYVKKDKIHELLNANQIDWTDIRIVQGIQKQKDLLDAGFYNEDVLTAGWADAQTAIMEGTAAMFVDNSYPIGPLVEKYGIDAVNSKIGFFVLSEKDGVCDTIVSCGLWVPKTGNADKEAAAKKFLDWFSSSSAYQDYVNTIGELPVYAGFEAPTVSQAIIDGGNAMAESSASNIDALIAASYGDFPTLCSELAAGQKTPLEVAQSLDDTFTANAVEMGLPGF